MLVTLHIWDTKLSTSLYYNACTPSLDGVHEFSPNMMTSRRPKSLLAMKSFAPMRSLAALKQCLSVLARELVDRVEEDSTAFRRRPKTLVLHHTKAAHTNPLPHCPHIDCRHPDYPRSS